MNSDFTDEIRRIVIFLLLSVLFGLINGYLLLTLALAVLGYLGWTLWNLRRFHKWLTRFRLESPPDASGVWGDMFDSVIRLQKRQRRERAKLQMVIKRGQETTAALRDGMILLNSDNDIEWFNSSAGQLLGLRTQDQGNSLVNFIRHPRFVSYMGQGKFDIPLDLPSPQAEAIRLQYQLTRFGQGECLIVVRDITRVYKLEQMRKDFVANVSHELRTPLTVIRGYVETLQMSQELPEKWQTVMLQMEQQSNRMTNLIQDLIELSKLETNESLTSPCAFELEPLLEQIREDGLALSADRGHTITLKCPPDITIVGSESELQSGFSNLVFNAIKYSPQGCQINITVRRNGLGLTVAIKDQGPGIAAIHLPRLTERFYRVDSSRNSGTGGTGLGLAIVKHVMLRHGGRLNIKSKVGKGSTFTCIFPIQRIGTVGDQLPRLVY